MSQQRPRVLIVQPKSDDGPAYLARWLSERCIAYRTCNIEAGDAVPTQARDWDAIAMLGGSMSANDDLPFLRDAERLLRDAVAHDVPVIGHCLGGQVLAQALGARVTDNPVVEIGWSRIRPAETAAGRAWLGEARELPVYQWHYQTFELPNGATRVAGNAACANQAFAFGPHLGMQFHIEVDEAKLERWCREAPRPDSPLASAFSVQTEAAMRADTGRWLARSQRIAAGIYTRWLALAAQHRR